MFKKVEYAGFEEHPELKALAERATAVLAEEIDDWQNRVEICWQYSENPQAPLIINITLHQSFSSSSVSWSFLSDDLQDDESLQYRCRRVWSSLLLRFVRDRGKEWEKEESTLQTSEIQ